MKTSYLYTLVLGSLAFGLASCNQPGIMKKGAIDVVASFASPVELKASDCFRKIRYLPLETSDSCLVGSGPLIRIFGDKIIVTTSQQQCLLFDKATGRFISSVGHVGNDPEGYSGVTHFTDDKPDGTIYFNGWHNELVSYGADGNFRGKVKVPLESKERIAGLYNCVNDDIFLGYYSGPFGDGKDRILFFRDDEALRTIALTRDSPGESINPSEIESISVLNGEPATEKYGSAGREGVLVMNFKGPETGCISFMGSNSMWHVGKDLYFKDTYNDTIYQVVDTMLIPSTVFGLGTYHWDYADRYNKARGKDAILIGQVLDSKEYMLFNFIVDIFNKAEVYNGLYNKNSGELKVGTYKEGLKDDLTYFMPLQPWTVSPAGEYASLIPAEKVVEWFTDNAGKQEALASELQVLKRVGEEDNPVIVLME